MGSLLFNIVFNDLNSTTNKFDLIMYAEDTTQLWLMNHGFRNTFDYNYCMWSGTLLHSDCKWLHYMLISICDIFETTKMKGLWNFNYFETKLFLHTE